MEIKNQTAYTYDTLLEFNRQHNRILRLLATVLTSACAGFLLITTGLTLILFTFGLTEAPESFTMGVTFIYSILALFFLIGLPILRRFVCRKQAKQNTRVEFVFQADQFSQVYESNHMSGRADCQYDMIIRVKESKHAFYLYNRRNVAFIVSKSGFTQGCEEDFRLLLRTVINPKKLHIK